ncbi:xylan 1,4-beta-xylosidase [Streptomyces sp. NPDC101393]|uniref:xylan 1,4-beta-xylosidase n=1 Tax=Streptomyces sp. NPDC101393 TaxID=3366141 RepID=UPI00380DC585
MALLAGMAVLAALLARCGGPDGQGADHKHPARPGAVRPVVGWGFTHTQFSADQGADSATERAARMLSDVPMPQNQHIMGWGADNPEPSPGRYDFADLDRRVALIRATGGTPVLTLCCAPDWMKGGAAGHTDWGTLEKAPDPSHYADFAALAGKIARRYPDIRHFIVWNEFKGFFDDAKGRWNYEGYTRLYNLVHRELKKADQDNQVGGPYLVMDSYVPGDTTYASALKGPWGSVDQRTLDALAYWNRHKSGADFLVVDGSSYSKDDHYAPDPFAATRKFADVGRWVRKETGLPLWWAEWYVEVADESDDRDGWSERKRTAAQAAALIEMVRGGASGGLYWNPQNEGADCPGCLWRSTELSDGGAKLPMMDLLSRFSRSFPPGVRLQDIGVEVAGGDLTKVRVLADARTALIVNTTGRRVEATVGKEDVTLGGYEVRWLTR